MSQAIRSKMNRNELQTENGGKGRKSGILLKVSSIFKEKIYPWIKNFIRAVFQNVQNFPRPSAIVQGDWRFYVTFVFDPLHLPPIANKKYPFHLPGYA